MNTTAARPSADVGRFSERGKFVKTFTHFLWRTRRHSDAHAVIAPDPGPIPRKHMSFAAYFGVDQDKFVTEPPREFGSARVIRTRAICPTSASGASA